MLKVLFVLLFSCALIPWMFASRLVIHPKDLSPDIQVSLYESNPVDGQSVNVTLVTVTVLGQDDADQVIVEIRYMQKLALSIGTVTDILRTRTAVVPYIKGVAVAVDDLPCLKKDVKVVKVMLVKNVAERQVDF